MTKSLNVILNKEIVGQLTQDPSGEMSFEYSNFWLSKNNSYPISISLPLQQNKFKNRECKPFFAGILPEEENRKIIAKNLGISAANDFAMLDKIGGECAGALTFQKASEEFYLIDSYYHLLTEMELIDIISELPIRPLLAGERGVRLSLAGAQDKIAITIENNKFMLPINGALSTHIIKPAIPKYEKIVYNEKFCLDLASSIGLKSAKASIRKFGDIDCLIIERFDREYDKENKLQRLHQEDFCQALGYVPELKYQIEGGPSLNECFNLIREKFAIPVLDITTLLEGVIYNYFIGNNDAHAKNFSLIYKNNNDRIELRLAPFYDMLSTRVYPELSQNMAMKIGRKYDSELLLTQDWEDFATNCNLSIPLLKKKLNEIATRIMSNIDNIENKDKVSKVVEVIKTRCKNYL